MRLTRFLSITIVAGLTLGFPICHVDSVASGPRVLRFDAEWWKQANSSEQQGFIYGYWDCRQPSKAAKASIDDYQQAVSAALGTERNADPDAVTKAIEYAWTTLKSRDTRGGEFYSGPHGYLDGEWWGEYTDSWPSNVAEMDRGYVEGYLECSSTPVTVQTVRRYQTAINQHYASGLHSHDKIADVLHPLLKPPVTSQK